MASKVRGSNGDVEVRHTADGKVIVTAELDSHADAMVAANDLARRQRGQMSGLDKAVHFDRHVSPKFREFMVTITKLAAISFVVILGITIAIQSGHGANFIFPDAPMPQWLLFTLGAITVVGGIWATDELIKLIRDDIEDREQKVRRTGLIAVIAFCLLFDAIGVVTTRVAASTGSIIDLRNARDEEHTLRLEIAKAKEELTLLEPPLVPSASYSKQIDAILSEPTVSGKPVSTVGELMALCQTAPKKYCHAYQSKFSRINYLENERLKAENAENRGPELEAIIEGKQAEMANLQLTGPTVVDEFFAAGETAMERDENAKRVRFWRTIVVSLGQVLVFAALVLYLLDDRHDQIARRRKLAAKKNAEV